MGSHAASLNQSPRLRRVAALLSGGGEYTTRDIVRRCDVCAVNAIVHELRENGLDVRCRQATAGGRRVWRYSLVAPTRGQRA